MKRLNSENNVFEKCENDDEVILQVGGRTRNVTLTEDTSMHTDTKQFYLGDPENNRVLLVDELEDLVVKKVTKTGLEVNGTKVTCLINYTKEIWGGDKEFYEKFVRTENTD